MEKIGFIEIRITGSKGNLDLTPDNYDIREIISILETAENLLHPGDKKDRSTISYRIEEGSVKHIFKTSIQTIIGFNAIIGQVSEVQTIDFLDLGTAKAFENIQDIATKRNYVFSITTSLDNTNEVRVDKTTQFYRTEAICEHSETGEVDTSSLVFIELVDYQPKYDEDYLNGLRDKAKKSWLGSIN
ncbi:MAG: hypothetical protein NTZ00_09060, partial [Bacteroidetes bacterium]|nr:hypothetical protein [Bacteroidota bacterium]